MDCGDPFEPYYKTFPETVLKPYAEPAAASEMKKGRVYFACHFMDEEMFVPILTPMIYLGNLDPNEPELRLFQNFDSFRCEVRYPEDYSGHEDSFEWYGPDEGKHIFEFDRALETLMRCAIRRKESADPDL